jgi:solute carrier family 25 folate transporter 32
VYFPIYEYIKHSFNANEKKLTNMQVFLSSVVSKRTENINPVIACTVTYPHIVIRTLMHDNRSSKHLRIRDIVREVYSKSGVKGFFLGLKPDLIRVIPSNAITFVVY